VASFINSSLILLLHLSKQHDAFLAFYDCCSLRASLRGSCTGNVSSQGTWLEIFGSHLRFLCLQNPVAFDMVKSTSKNLISETNAFQGAFVAPDDGFEKYQRGVSPTIPFQLVDDSAGSFPPDDQGIVKTGDNDVFFGVADTENPQNSGPVDATWKFDISSGGTVPLLLCIDMAAMGDFETSNDEFSWSYVIDAGSISTVFQSTVDESSSLTYTMENGALVSLNDPMLVNGEILTNDFHTFCTNLAGSGSELELKLEATTNGGDEAFAFKNIKIIGQCSTCSENNPCPPDQVILEQQFYFTHCDKFKFVQCSQWGSCYEMPCAPGTEWSQEVLTCVRSN